MPPNTRRPSSEERKLEEQDSGRRTMAKYVAFKNEIKKLLVYNLRFHLCISRVKLFDPGSRPGDTV